MNSKLRVLFMGTPDFAVHILNTLVQNNYNVVGVVSVPDKPAGRGQKMHESAVTRYAKKNDLRLFQPEKLKSDEFVQAIQDLQIDVTVVVAFRMLPKMVWKIPKLGTFNLHASLLPQYRGAAPINWAIINGETISGVTTFLIDEKIDTGEILLQQEVEIQSDDTAGDLHDQLMEEGAQLVIKTLDGLEAKTLTPTPQTEPDVIKPAPKIFKEDCQIDWSKSLEDIYNFIRGMSPYPTAWTMVSNNSDTKLLKIYKASIQYGDQNKNIHELYTEDGKLGIAHPSGVIWLEEVQLAGKRKMNAKDFINGYNFDQNPRVVNN